MKRVGGIFIFLILVITMLVLPNYPALHYYIHKTIISNADITIENSNNLIGDLSYLAAITKRTMDIDKVNSKKTPDKPPKPKKELNNLFYLLNDFNPVHFLKNSSLNFILFNDKIINRFLPVNNPPPVL